MSKEEWVRERSNTERYDVVDFIISTLMEHEKKLDSMLTRFHYTLDRLDLTLDTMRLIEKNIGRKNQDVK